MPIENLINRECVLLLRSPSGSTDEYGNELVVETLVSTVCELQPRRVDEAGDEGEVSDDDYVAYFLPRDLSTADAVVVDGATYEFTGKPPVRRNPRTGTDIYAKAFVRRIAGAGDVT